ncbi:MAG: cyanophycin synthetase, partial [Deltaproteobacteria bacterium]|nr:cyanophycin synthetase [Deltaproteobacteria bacterium]
VGVLGDTVERIAWHKAGVARPGAPLVTGASGAALAVVEREAQALGAPVIRVPSGAGAVSHNRALAAEAARQFTTGHGIALDDGQVARGLDRVRLAGRSEVMHGDGPRVVLDGAHNPDKLRVAIDAALSGAGAGPKVAVVGILRSKSGLDVAAPFAGRFDRVIATEPRVYGKPACPARETATLFAGKGCRAEAIPDPLEAVSAAVARAGTDGTVLVTGSFYLIGEVRERWYAKEAVVALQTSFPHLEGKHSAK